MVTQSYMIPYIHFKFLVCNISSWRTLWFCYDCGSTVKQLLICLKVSQCKPQQEEMRNYLEKHHVDAGFWILSKLIAHWKSFSILIMCLYTVPYSSLHLLLFLFYVSMCTWKHTIFVWQLNIVTLLQYVAAITEESWYRMCFASFFQTNILLDTTGSSSSTPQLLTKTVKTVPHSISWWCSLVEYFLACMCARRCSYLYLWCLNQSSWASETGTVLLQMTGHPFRPEAAEDAQ